LALLPGGSELVYIQGPIGTSTAIRRYGGVREVLREVSLDVFTLHSDWTRKGGERALLDWSNVFKSRELPAFIVGAQNDAMAMGARDAVGSLAKDHPKLNAESVFFLGCDGSPTFGQRLVIERQLAATVIIPVCAGRALAEIASMLRGGPIPPATLALKPEPFPEPHLLTRHARNVHS
jgi:ABC-type sugar transport system substrate-binding protein